MSKKTKMMFNPQQLAWLKEQLTHKHAAYNVVIRDQNGHEEETQGNYHDDVNEFCLWLQEMINEIEWPKHDGSLQLIRSYQIVSVTFDHYLAEEGIEDKQYSSPEWHELPMVTLFVPAKNQIVQITEGDGSNLSSEDMENGLVDYIYYSQYDIDNLTQEADGGQIDQYELLRDKYKSLEEVIPEVFEFAYGDPDLMYIVLRGAAVTESV